MDEPFAALDAQTRETLQDELLRIWRRTGKTILFITHGIDEAVVLGQRVAVMTSRPGRIKHVVEIPEALRSEAEDVRSLARVRSGPARGLVLAARGSVESPAARQGAGAARASARRRKLPMSSLEMLTLLELAQGRPAASGNAGKAVPSRRGQSQRARWRLLFGQRSLLLLVLLAVWEAAPTAGPDRSDVPAAVFRSDRGRLAACAKRRAL